MSWAAVLLVALTACQSAPTAPNPYSPVSATTRNTVEAERLTREATEWMHDDPAKAEAILREALTADLFFGPAHNNLGVLFLKQGKRYDAASEFEWARKLMPGHPDPRVNLAITLEEAGRVDDALASYSAALEVAPTYLPAIQGLARLSIRSGRENEHLEQWLETIALQGQDRTWIEWAKRESNRAW